MIDHLREILEGKFTPNIILVRFICVSSCHNKNMSIIQVSGRTWLEWSPGWYVVSEEPFPLSEMLGGVDLVVRAGKGSLWGRGRAFSVVFSPVMLMGDRRERIYKSYPKNVHIQLLISQPHTQIPSLCAIECACILPLCTHMHKHTIHKY